jgi:hypothetical protein
MVPSFRRPGILIIRYIENNVNQNRIIEDDPAAILDRSCTDIISGRPLLSSRFTGKSPIDSFKEVIGVPAIHFCTASWHALRYRTT